MDPYRGKMLDNRYELLERIGTGGMAVVYKARCHRLNRLVAVKILKPELAQDGEFRRRFHDESQAVAMLSHPNIMAVYDVSHSDELDYIVMELLEGITLKQYMQKKGLPLPWREALHFITQITKALSHAHSRGIIHRDIKPQNIMVLRDGSVKVADFGIARRTSADQSTFTQEALGSVHYISPEQARGSFIDARSDLYSAGVVLYEMTAGRLPFEGETAVSVALQHIRSIPLSPRDLNPDIPPALEAVILKAMAPDVAKRYVSASAMLEDLEEVRKNPSIHFDYPADTLAAVAVDEPTVVCTVDEPTRVLPEEMRSSAKTPPASTRRRRREEEEEDYDDDEEDDDRRGGILPILLAVGAVLIFVIGIGYFLWGAVFGNILNTDVPEYTVPNLIGMTIAEVNQDIAKGNIDSVFQIVEGDTVISDLPAGQIVSQDPKANESRKGDTITITVSISAGPNVITMPDLEGVEYRQAMATLQNMGMTVTLAYDTSETVEESHVISTDPVVGVILSDGQTITLTVSTGPEMTPVVVPYFLYQNIDDVLEQLEELMLLADVSEVVDEEHEKGTVIYQSITANTQVDQGTTIVFQIASGPNDEEDPTEEEGEEEPEEEAAEESSSTGSTTVAVDLSAYHNPVQIRIEVGGTTVYENLVDPLLGLFTQTITGEGSQIVDIYLDEVLYQSLAVDFNA